MFDFKTISFDDRDWITQALKVSDFRGAEYCFANNMAWHRLNDTQICRCGDFYISCSLFDGQPYVTFPSGVVTDDSGREKYLSLFAQLKKFFEAQGKVLAISSITEQNLEWIKQAYGESIEVTCDRDSSDYIYNSEDLITFKGKKFHGKRNHLKHFMQTDWSYEPISEANLDECIAYAVQSYNHKEDKNFSAIVEQYAINFFFMNMQKLGLKGGAIKSDGKLVGISVGEQLNSDTFVVHIEKADPTLNGAYPAICSQFAAHNASELKYINREEDMGIEGLRKSKLSYNPIFLLDKYTVKFK